MENAKLFLREVRHTVREVGNLEMKLEYLRKSTLPGGMRYDKARVQTSPDDKFSDIMAEIGDLESQLEKDILSLTSNITRARHMIGTLGSAIQRDVLTRYYLPDISPTDELPTWRDIAISLHFSEGRVLHIHGKALQELNGRRNNG